MVFSLCQVYQIPFCQINNQINYAPQLILDSQIYQIIIMAEMHRPQILSPQLYSTQESRSPIKYKGISRVSQMYVSKLLLKACQTPPLYPPQPTPYKDLFVVTSKLPIYNNLNQLKARAQSNKVHSNNFVNFNSEINVKKKNISEIFEQKEDKLGSSTIKVNTKQIKSQSWKINPIKEKLPEIKDEKKEIKKSKNLPLLSRQPSELKNVKSQSYIMIQHPSNQIVFSNNSSLSLEIASLTKIMTFYVIRKIAFENKVNIKDEKIIVHDEITEVSGTIAQILGGQQYTVEQLLYGLMLPSGNDAALCLAEWGGQFLKNQTDRNIKIKYFVREMNKSANQLQLEGSRFGNPHGLPHLQSRSNAFDVAKLCSICLKDELFAEVVKTKKYKLKVRNTQLNTSRQIEWENTNKLLRRQNFIGLKTGITVTAGPCLASAYKFRDKTYITVVLRASKISTRFKDTRRIIYWALTKLYKSSLTEAEAKIIHQIKKNKQDIDSDNSEDQHQFKYELTNKSQFKKRCSILSYQL